MVIEKHALVSPLKMRIHVKINKASAGMAELADAHGSGPCESNFMQVQVLLPAPNRVFLQYPNSTVRPLDFYVCTTPHTQAAHE